MWEDLPEFRQLLDGFADAVVVADEGGVIGYANQATKTLLGWDPDTLVGQPLTTLVPERLREAHLRGFARYLTEREPRLIGHPVRLPARHVDGSEVTVELTLAALPAARGELFVGALRDLRARVELERETAVSRRLLEILASASPLETSLPRVLEALGDSLGWDVAGFWEPDEEADVLRCRALWHDPTLDVEPFLSATRGQVLPPDVGLPGRVWSSGAPAWLPAIAGDENFPRARAAEAAGLHGGFAVPVRLGGRVVGVVELFRRRATEEEPQLMRTMTEIGSQLGQFIQHRLIFEALGASRERLDLALDTAGMGIWEWDHAAQRFRWSPEAEAVCGFARGTLPVTRERWRALVHPDDVEAVDAAVDDAWGSASEFTVEHRIVPPGGSVRWVEAKGRVLRDGAGQQTGFLGVLRDITDRKEAEAEREQLNRERLRVAEALQRSLLPPALPTIPGVEFASRYRAMTRGQIGGDFFDVFPLRGEAWGLVIGDVQGKGPDAAAVIATVRYALRTAAMRARSPRRALSQLNDAMLLGTGTEVVEDSRFCTLVFVRLQPDEGGARVQIANGGHPPPLIVRADGEVEALWAPGMLVGAFPEADFGQAQATLAPGDAIVLYTDGVTEARVGTELFGQDRLVAELGAAAGRSAETLAACVYDRVLEVASQPSDDLALLVARVTPRG